MTRRSPLGLHSRSPAVGFRATLFHLGVVRFLRSANLLQEIRHIASVSGGSILAGHLAVNWDRYCGTPKQFETAAREILRFCERDVRGRIMRRLPLILLARLLRLPRRLAPRSTTDCLERELRRLFGNVNLADLRTRQPSVPELSIVATDLTHPGIAQFEAGRVVVLPLGNAKPIEFPGSATPLALAVAASAAFPAFFAPLGIKHEDLRLPEGYGVHYHTDGGVVDNQGLIAVLESEGQPERIIVSDASESSLSSRPITRFGLVDSGFRATELMMAQIRSERYTELAERRDIVSAVLEIETIVNTEGASAEAIQAQLPHVRTDLDRFDRIEQDELVRHGFWIASNKLGTNRHDPSYEPPPPGRVGPAKVVDHLRSRFGWRLGFFGLRDRVWLLYGLVLVAAVMFGAPYLPDLFRLASGIVLYASSAQVLSRDIPDFPSRPPTSIEPLSSFPDPTNEGFQVLAEHRVWDLRELSLIEERDDQNRKRQVVDGPAYLTRFTELKRTQDTAVTFGYLFETSGALQVWLGEADERLRIRVSGPQPKVNGSSDVLPYLGEVDCRRVRLGDRFNITIHAMYTRSFLGRNDWWIAMKMLNPLEKASMRIIFPRNLPFENPTFRRYPNNWRIESKVFDGKALRLPKIAPELFWEVPDPIPGQTYRVNWDWLPGVSSLESP